MRDLVLWTVLIGAVPTIAYAQTPALSYAGTATASASLPSKSLGLALLAKRVGLPTELSGVLSLTIRRTGDALEGEGQVELPASIKDTFKNASGRFRIVGRVTGNVATGVVKLGGMELPWNGTVTERVLRGRAVGLGEFADVQFDDVRVAKLTLAYDATFELRR